MLVELHEAARQARVKGDTAQASALQAQLTALEKQITFITQAVNISEDKADTGGKISFPLNGYASMLYAGRPNLQAKFIYSFARVAQHNPRLAVYLAGTSRHGDNTPGANPMVQQAISAIICTPARTVIDAPLP